MRVSNVELCVRAHSSCTDDWIIAKAVLVSETTTTVCSDDTIPIEYQAHIIYLETRGIIKTRFICAMAAYKFIVWRANCHHRLARSRAVASPFARRSRSGLAF